MTQLPGCFALTVAVYVPELATVATVSLLLIHLAGIWPIDAPEIENDNVAVLSGSSVRVVAEIDIGYPLQVK